MANGYPSPPKPIIWTHSTGSTSTNIVWDIQSWGEVIPKVAHVQKPNQVHYTGLNGCCIGWLLKTDPSQQFQQICPTCSTKIEWKTNAWEAAGPRHDT